MIWLTNPVPDFDAGKRRWLYALSLGVVSATSNAVIITQRADTSLAEEIWYAAVLGGVYFILNLLIGYALWSRPYSTRLRSVFVSLLTAAMAYIVLYAVILLIQTVALLEFGIAWSYLKSSFQTIISFQIETWGIPYIAAAFVGWRFAKPAPDISETF